MKKRIKLLSLLLVSCLMLSGCSIGKLHIYASSSSGLNKVFKVGDMKCSKEEFRIYLANYKNIYGEYDGVSLWDNQDSEEEIQEGMKAAVLAHLTRVYALNQYAKDQGIELTSDEIKSCKDAAKAYYKTLNRTEKRYTKASKSEIAEMYEHYALAEKVYVELMNSVDDEVSEDEARMIDAYVMLVEKKSDAKKIDKALKNGATFGRLAGTYSKLDTALQTFGRGEYPDEVDKVAFELEDDEVSSMIKTSDGYYFVYCQDKYNKEESELNKSNVISKRKQQVIDDIISDQDEKYYSHINKRLYKKIKVNNSEKITTNTFFSNLDSYISYK